jgi:hypothetical protein
VSASVLDVFEPPVDLPGQVARRVLSDTRPKVELPGDNRLLGDFAEEVGQLLRSTGLFRRERTAVTLGERGDCLRPVGEQELRTWVERHLVCFSAHQGTGRNAVRIEVLRTMSNDVARALAASDQFLQGLPAIERVNSARLPVLRADGRIELLPRGYDPASRTLTVSDPATSDASPCLSLEAARAILDDLFAEFGFADGGRSKSVAVAAMVSLFSRGLLPPSALMPGFFYVANAPGAGKTLCAACAAVPVLGHAHHMPLPTREEEIEKILLAAVMESQSLLFFDNLKRHASLGSLESFITSVHYQGRILSVSRTFSGRNSTTVFLTGNGATVSPDLRRRLLFVELFSDCSRPEERTFKRRLNEAVLLERRAEILGALWGLVQAWDAAGRPAGSGSFASFDEWCTVVGGIVEHAGFGCPTARATLTDAGDTDGDQIARLVDLLFSAHGSAPLRFEEVVSAATGASLFESLLGDDPADVDRKARTTFSRILGRHARMRFGERGLRLMVLGEGRNRRYQVIPDAQLQPQAAQ